MANDVLYVDDLDMTTVGLFVQRAEGWTDRAVSTIPTAMVPDAPRAIVVGQAQIQPRQVRVESVLKGSTLAAFRANLDTVRYLLRPGSRTIRLVDQNDRDATGYVNTLVESVDPVQFARRLARFSVGIEFPDPKRYTITPNSESFSSSATVMPMGTALVRPVITISGAATDPTLRYRHNDNTLLASMAFTISLAGGESLVIDMDNFTIIKNPGGTNQMAALTSGDFFALDPNDGDYTLSQWPKLEVTTGSGNAAYRRAWW